jgi:hypothetical protein
MTKMSKQIIKCPECDTAHRFTIYDSVNVALDSSLKDRVLSGELILFRCPDCGSQTVVLYPLLYHDMHKKFMICLIGKEFYGSGTFDAPGQGMHLLSFMEPYRLRVVFTMHELIEKILIFDEGLDDRAVERVKPAVRAWQKKNDLECGLLLFRGLVKDKDDQVQLILTNYCGNGESYAAVPYRLYETARMSFVKNRKDESGRAVNWLRVDVTYPGSCTDDACRTKSTY